MRNQNRKNLRLPHYDYSLPGAYFITIVTYNRRCMFGSIVNGEMILNDAGQMIDSVCIELSNVNPGVELEPYIIMPNHFHAVVTINSNSLSTDFLLSVVRNDVCQKDMEVEKSKISLPKVVQRFKSITTRRYIDGVERYNWPRFDQHLWQRNYY